MNATMALCTLVQKRFEGAFTSSTVKPHALRVAPNHPRSNNLRLAVRVQAAEDSDIDLPSSFSEPDTARAAIEVGLKLTQEQRWEDAQVYFERALTLPGTGIKRFRDKPKQLSDGERIAVMYNIACCQSKAGEEENIQNGLIAIAGCLETGTNRK